MSSPLQILARLTPAERQVLKIQFLTVLAICVLLSVGYYGHQEWHRFVAEPRFFLSIDRWDGLAWFIWLGIAPVMLILIHRFPLTPGEVRRNLTGLILCSLLLCLVVANIRACLLILLNSWLSPASYVPVDSFTYLHTTLALLPVNVLTFCGFFAVFFAIDHHFRFRQRAYLAMQLQIQTAQLASQLSQAELAMLRNQLHPHFLFNSFNAVATLVRQKKNETALEVITQLSALLRRALDRTEVAAISLEEEMDFIRRYLDIEKVRFGEKLQVDFSIDPVSLGALVPNLFLQPLVENAIKHGISQRTDPGSVSIVAARNHDRLEIEIANDGPVGPAVIANGTGGKSPGIGLANTRLRLEKLYGSNYRFEIKARGEGGMSVRLNLPWQLAPAPTEAAAP